MMKTFPSGVRSARRTLHAQPTRDSFLAAVYVAGLVACGPGLLPWTNKWFQHQTLLSWNPAAAQYLPWTLALAELPVADLEPWLAAHLPSGFIAKPSVGHSSEGAGQITRMEDLLTALPLLLEEEWILQERVGSGMGRGAVDEFRVHTFWHRVVPEATFSRWDMLWDDDLFIEIEGAVQRFLDLFPEEKLRGHAWGLDVIRLGPGQIRVVDLNTNRGEPRKWSGDLAAPDVLGAYVRHLEAHHEVDFAGWEGEWLRTNRADRRKWIKKAGSESVRRHEELRQQSWRLRRFQDSPGSAT